MAHHTHNLGANLMAYNIRSRYQDSWEALKKHSHITLTAPSAFHPRLKEAIKKRKKKDTGFLFLLGEENKEAKLRFKSEGAMLRIYLSIKVRSTWL